ncbi:hypothetical protein BJ742DRAFT_870513 [Cladochytrium replicatum]|nr:hypothetical protein BJ742DRAFT_870513 [Cladochytrium replicatum]
MSPPIAAAGVFPVLCCLQERVLLCGFEISFEMRSIVWGFCGSLRSWMSAQFWNLWCCVIKLELCTKLVFIDPATVFIKLVFIDRATVFIKLGLWSLWAVRLARRGQCCSIHVCWWDFRRSPWGHVHRRLAPQSVKICPDTNFVKGMNYADITSPTSQAIVKRMVSEGNNLLSHTFRKRVL